MIDAALPWQRAYVERVIGSIRRECLNQVIVFDEGSLRPILASYFDYYHRARTQLSRGKDSREPRPMQPTLQRAGCGDISGGWLAPSVRATGRLKPPRSAHGSAVLLDLLTSVSDMRVHASLLTIDSAKLVHERKQSSQPVARSDSCGAQRAPDPVCHFRQPQTGANVINIEFMLQSH
jgi:hypothetical protein